MWTLPNLHLARLQYNPSTYLGNCGPAAITTTSGVVVRHLVVIEVEIVNARGETIAPWFAEYAIITPDHPGLFRLSGGYVRNQLYLATAPGINTLYVAKKKNGIVS